jgi:hypothetical protein
LQIFHMRKLVRRQLISSTIPGARDDAVTLAIGQSM